MIALEELSEKGKNKIEEDNGSEMLVAKSLGLIENMLDLQPETVSNKLMHADNLVDFLLLIQE